MKGRHIEYKYIFYTSGGTEDASYKVKHAGSRRGVPERIGRKQRISLKKPPDHADRLLSNQCKFLPLYRQLIDILCNAKDWPPRRPYRQYLFDAIIGMKNR